MRGIVMLIISLPILALAYVLVSVKPIALMVREIYQGQVKILIDPSENPHTFQLTPSSMRDVEKADILVVFGEGFEKWLERIKGIKICRLDNAIGKEPQNPHVWLDPVLAQAMAVKLERCLEKVHPDEKENMRKNLVDFLNDLSVETEKLGSEFKGMDGTILELRPALYHFVKRFFEGGYVTLVGQSQPSLTPKRLREVLKMCRREDIRKIIVEKNSSDKIAYPVIRGCKLRVVKVDVLGSDAKNYVEMLENVADAVEEALK